MHRCVDRMMLHRSAGSAASQVGTRMDPGKSFGEGSITMARKEGSRWDVGTKDDTITLERFDDSNDRVSEDVLEVDEARELAALLTKHADKLESSDKGDSKDDSKDKDDSDEKESSDDS